MNIPKSVLNKIQRLKELRSKADTLEYDIMQWFEGKGIDTTDSGFTDVVGSKITYCEFNDAEEINEPLQEFLNGRFK